MTEEALRSTARFLERLIELPADATGRILSRVMSNPGMIHSGERMNVIAQRCELEMDMRIPWGCSYDEVIRTIRESVPEAKVDMVVSSEASFSTPGWLCRLVYKRVQSVLGVPAKPGESPPGGV